MQFLNFFTPPTKKDKFNLSLVVEIWLTTWGKPSLRHRRNVVMSLTQRQYPCSAPSPPPQRTQQITGKASLISH